VAPDEAQRQVDHELDLRRQQAADYDQAIARSQAQRETHVQAALVSGATFLTLMSASATGRVDASQSRHLLAAQFLLCLLFGGVFAYYLNAIYHHALRIADNAARRLELEEQGGITEIEGPGYLKGPRTWRTRSRCPTWALALIPRYGQSQRDAALFLPIVAMLPAAWFALTDGRTGIEDVVVVGLTGLLVLFVIRQLFAGCRHWVWVHPKALRRVRSVSDEPARAWGWWFDLQTAEYDETTRRVSEIR
jgi:hypothetical protein